MEQVSDKMGLKKNKKGFSAFRKSLFNPFVTNEPGYTSNPGLKQRKG